MAAATEYYRGKKSGYLKLIPPLTQKGLARTPDILLYEAVLNLHKYYTGVRLVIFKFQLVN